MSTDRQRNLEVVEQFFSGPRDLDRLSLLSDDCEWFNGIGKFPAAPGQTVFTGKDEIGRVVLGRAPSPPPPSGRKVDRYDLTTARFHDAEPSPTARTSSASTATPRRRSVAATTRTCTASSSASTTTA